MKKSRIVFISILFLCTVGVGCNTGNRPNLPAEKVREFANELYNRYLFKQAIEQYRFYLSQYPLSTDEQANVTYRIANIYFERLHDYENALAEYLKIRSLYPESKLIHEVNKKIVACLERLQRPEDARQALHESADLEPPQKENKPGTVIARIGDREITEADLEYELRQLPPEIRAQYLSDRQKKLEFLRRYIATELMYDSAKRQGLDNDKEVLEQLFQAKKSLMVQKLLEQEISPRIKIEPEDVELYYKANKDRYVEKDRDGKVIRQLPFEEVQQRVAQDLFLERQQKVYQELISSYLRAENVQIFDDLVK